MLNKIFLLFLGSIGSISFVEYHHYLKNKDLDFIYHELRNNHPGFYNDQDLEFKNILQQGYDQAKNKISQQYWWQDHIIILKEYLKKFHDSHLRIYKEDVVQDKNRSIEHNISCFDLFQDDTLLITIPTFMPNQEQQEQFKRLIQELSSRKNIKNIVFDLRHNSGGSSELGTKILKALFGPEYVDQQLYNIYKNQSVWWRASKENSIYLYELIKRFSDNKELYKDLLIWLENIAQKVQQALEDNKIFFVEQESVGYIKNNNKFICPIVGKIIVVIDENNVSAALDFITELQALREDVIFIGHTTDADTIYMEVRIVLLPSKLARLQYPIKMYHNRPRANNQKYNPDIVCPSKNIDDAWVLDTIKKVIG